MKYQLDLTQAPEMAICSRCGQAIKHVYTWNGETYGSTCIERVTGIGIDYQVYNDGEFDLEASQQRKAEVEARREAESKAFVEHIRTTQENQDTNREKYAELICVLEQASNYEPGNPLKNYPDFCWDIARQIEACGSTTDLRGMFSPNQFNVIRDIWGKQSGRKNSKAFKAAVAEFDEKFLA